MKTRAALLFVAVFVLSIPAVAAEPTEAVEPAEADQPAEPVQAAEAEEVVETVEVDITASETLALCSEDHVFVEQGCAQASFEPDPLQDRRGDWVCTENAECSTLDCVSSPSNSCWQLMIGPYTCCACEDTLCTWDGEPPCYPNGCMP